MTRPTKHKYWVAYKATLHNERGDVFESIDGEMGLTLDAEVTEFEHIEGMGQIIARSIYEERLREQKPIPENIKVRTLPGWSYLGTTTLIETANVMPLPKGAWR